ncbi:hypothetical protein G6F57_008201 [Rhizopus arrhizus]|uniref:EF-hand domain-containing protein n=1 Tax=Rhizopus oryzae TaxID=64495 RepID=A0A9P7BVH2_RHIOR|nr:hypothetical protein G6F23_008428 [Rhizopus arrhizus]KAG1412329.1 hypothetical protein G6F58_008067 [Rhizopus delemar]KAG0764312.1 hypothetical protein G6F24_005317 [Rhizopus arrhizus]KAG0786503.1 hypothetical protein G6F22_007607 [Rhizopus arrhizus]KAG0787356.1 hypothetical protein G6F21_007961 [Rhizopus arrhizus]
MRLFLLLLLFTCVFGIDFKNKEDHSNYGEFKHNKEHIQEHLNSLANNTDEPLPELSDKDMIYYLFLTHDQNGDGFLDGHELRQAFTDFGDEDGSKYISLEEVSEMIDHVLEEDDLNGDGLISWSEYLESQSYHHQA